MSLSESEAALGPYWSAQLALSLIGDMRPHYFRLIHVLHFSQSVSSILQVQVQKLLDFKTT